LWPRPALPAEEYENRFDTTEDNQYTFLNFSNLTKNATAKSTHSCFTLGVAITIFSGKLLQ